MMKSTLLKITKSLFPNYCLCCHDRSYRDIPLCQGCELDLPQNHHPCQYCSKPLDNALATLCGRCSSGDSWHDGIKAAYLYQRPISDWICDFKYHQKDYLSYLLAHLLHKGAEFDSSIDYLIPIPLHKKKLQQRGFNQAVLLAKRISKPNCISMENSLTKLKSTPAQAQLRRKERQKNLKNIFRCKKNYKGKTILLIDDVVTTATTINEAAKALKKSGAKKVYASIIASANSIRQ
jgi:competence protein ComFC